MGEVTLCQWVQGKWMKRKMLIVLDSRFDCLKDLLARSSQSRKRVRVRIKGKSRALLRSPLAIPLENGKSGDSMLSIHLIGNPHQHQHDRSSIS